MQSSPLPILSGIQMPLKIQTIHQQDTYLPLEIRTIQ